MLSIFVHQSSAVCSACFLLKNFRQVGPLIRGPIGSKVELEILSPGAQQIRKVVLTRQKILQAGPAPLEPRQVKSIRDTLSDGAQKAVKHLQKMAPAMQVKEEDEGYDPEAEEIVNRMEISAPFNYRVSTNFLDLLSSVRSD